MWMAGDTIFPGQSVPAAALGGLRVAKMVLQEAAQGLPRLSTRKWSAPARISGLHTVKGIFNPGEKI
jgi:hypothetical protein